MEIKLTIDKSLYTIEVEPQCFTAYKHGINAKKGDNFGKPTKTALGFFSNISNALKKIVQNEQSESQDSITLKEYAERIEKAYDNLLKQVDL